MGATNHTTNYNLPQFVGSDKPTWLGDVNGAMSSIDAQMKANHDLADTAKTTADTALTNAGTALENASTADGKAVNAQTTATSALNKSLQNESDIAKLNLTQFDTYNVSDMSLDYGSISSGSITVATNEDGSVGKIYGQVSIQGDGTHQIRHLTIPTTKLRPNAQMTINPCGFLQVANFNAEACSVTIATNGNIDILLYGYASGNAIAIIFPCLYFLKDFGDTPSQN